MVKTLERFCKNIVYTVERPNQKQLHDNRKENLEFSVTGIIPSQNILRLLPAEGKLLHIIYRLTYT